MLALPLILAVVAMASGATPSPGRSSGTPLGAATAVKPVPEAPSLAPSPTPQNAGHAPLCVGEYADDLSYLLPRARELEEREASYIFCIRATATYECPYYTAEGTLRRTRQQVTAHGTGFAYRQQDGATLILTNAHVAEWPAATDPEHKVDDVPNGCRRVSDKLKIVDNEADDYERDDIPLTRVVVDPQLDMAVLKAPAILPVLPWRVGRSAGLRERNVMNVRGFPLGAFRADNVGKVISPLDHDDQGDWDHDDFVIDALLSPGNSGSPVFAVSCKTGQFELVGVYHAAYSRGTALNVVVAIDQVRDLMTTLKRSPRPKTSPSPTLDRLARRALVSSLPGTFEPYFSLGAQPAEVRLRADGALLFEVLPHDFPVTTAPVLVFEDLPSRDPASFGVLGRIWAGRGAGLKVHEPSSLDAEDRGLVDRILDGLRHDARLAFDVRAAQRDGDGSRASFEGIEIMKRELAKVRVAHADLAQSATELSERLAPEAAEAAVSFADALTPPPPPSDVVEPTVLPGLAPASMSAAQKPSPAPVEGSRTAEKEIGKGGAR